jgi:predicted DNA-binding helix-hairpin-helix protein
MDTSDKLALLGGAARFEIANDRGRVSRPDGPRAALCVGDTLDGTANTLMRVLQSSYCEHDCAYCPLRKSNDPRRASFEPVELADAFATQWQKGKVAGLMLSSATDGDADGSMARMIDTVRILRARHGYEGYVHLKVLPGAGMAAIEEAAAVADRLSLNVEVPGEEFLGGLHTGKRWQEDILAPLARLRDLQREGSLRSGITSQLLVGVTAPGALTAADRAIAQGSRWLRREYDMRRVHFGTFTPSLGTPLADVPAPDPRRRARLYQWDWLATHYQYADVELDAAFDAAGSMPLALDPKLAVTMALPESDPVEVNSASYEQLLRVPGIGPISARRIVDLRHVGTLRDLRDLRSMGVSAARAAPFVLLDGRKAPEAPAALLKIKRQLRALQPQPVQLRLWPEP